MLGKGIEKVDTARRKNLHSGGVFELDHIAALVEADLNWSRVDPILVDAC